MIRRHVLICVGLIATACLSSAQAEDLRLKCETSSNRVPRVACETRDLESFISDTFDVYSRSGAITARGWAGNQVAIRAKVEIFSNRAPGASRLKEIAVTAERGVLGATGPSLEKNDWWQVTYELLVPPQTHLRLFAGNGNVTLEELDGRVEVELKNGNITVARCKSGLSGKTNNGDILLDVGAGAGPGELTALETHKGAVKVAVSSDFEGILSARTKSGRIQEADGLKAFGKQLSRSPGDTVWRFGNLDETRVRLQTGYGSVNMH